MEKIANNFQFFDKLRIGDLCNIRIAIVLAVTYRIVIHRLFKCGGNPHIVDDKTALLIAEHTIHTCDCLHQIMPAHRLVDVHRRE